MLRLASLFCLLTSAAYADGYGVGDTFEDPMQIAAQAFASFNPDQEGRPGIEVDVSVDFFNRITILVAETGFADDSVRGQRTQYLLEQGGDLTWTVTDTRITYLCGRGANTVTWQSDLCS